MARDTQVSTFDANGAGSVSFTASAQIKRTINIVAVSSGSARPTKATVSVNGLFVCGTRSGNGDTASGTPITLAATDKLTVSWAGGTPNAQGTASIQYEDG